MNNQSRFDAYERQEQNRLDQKAYAKFKKREAYFNNIKKWTWIVSILLSVFVCYSLFKTDFHMIFQEGPSQEFKDIAPSAIYTVLFILMVPLNAYGLAAFFSAWHLAKGVFIAIGIIGLAVSTSREGVLTSLLFFVMSIVIGVMIMSYAWIPYYLLQKYLHKRDKMKYAIA